GQSTERGRKDRPGPVLRPAEEAPRPLSRLDPLRRELRQFDAERIYARRHQVDEVPLFLEPERCKVELVMRDETGMLVTAAACEDDAVDRRMVRPRQLLEAAEPRQ